MSASSYCSKRKGKITPHYTMKELHSVDCDTLPINNRCRKCYLKYRKDRRLQIKLENEAKKYKTRSASKKSIYWYLFCQNCTNKSLKDLCRECLTKYECAKKQTYRNNLKIKQKETNEIQTMCHIPDEKIIKDNQCTKAILRGGSQVKHTKMMI